MPRRHQPGPSARPQITRSAGRQMTAAAVGTRLGPGRAELLLVRHAESVGNVARESSEAADSETIAIDVRDADVALSPLGRGQAAAFGHWLAALPSTQRPSRAWSSSYLRARETAEIALVGAGLECPLWVDERLRDRELGVLDRLTARGVRTRYPDEAERRRHLGKFYYRPPGGESWTDVVLRLRSFLRDISDLDRGVGLIVAHDAVVLLLRYICENLDEATLLDIARTRSVGNASITRLVRNDATGAWNLDLDNVQQHLIEHGSMPTAHEAAHDVDPR
jgi:broad specificity phosphatase PhoE